MRRALALAERGLGSVSPNPLVGCVIVSQGMIIGEGWHRAYGQGHAEVEAVRSVEDIGRIAGADVYVTLEPCSHYGKTPPCAELLASVLPARVIICNTDPNPKVNGNGVARLKEAGIVVTTGVLESMGKHLNRRFFTHILEKRPYIILKWAQTADGYIAREDGSSKWISGALSRKMVHKWRTEEDAIMVGTGTAILDNPQLTARDWPGSSPKRVFLDRLGKVPDSHALLDQTVTTYCITQQSGCDLHHLRYIPWQKKDTLRWVFEELGQRDIGSIIIEGGSKFLGSLVAEGLWDEARVFASAQRFSRGMKAPNIIGQQTLHTIVGKDSLTILEKNLQSHLL